ncbi:MAG: cupin [Spirochaetes bacterium]|nr:cupin [Spirochaetota bacterium]
MEDFPEFIKSENNKVPQDKQNTKDIDGFYYQCSDNRQLAFWTCNSDQVSRKHVNDFDEYMVCLSGEYRAYFDNMEFLLTPGMELFIPKGTQQWSKCIAGTRTLHFFGGKRI